ncbi:MAG: hypothetical protein ACYDHG_13835 [Desulfomonilaceae bacterium]
MSRRLNPGYRYPAIKPCLRGGAIGLGSRIMSFRTKREQPTHGYAVGNIRAGTPVGAIAWTRLMRKANPHIFRQ